MSAQYVDIYIGQRRFHRQSNPSSFGILGWVKLLDGEPITDLVIGSPAVQLKLTARRDDIDATFSSEEALTPRTLTVSRFIAMELALFFLKNEELPVRMAM